eukprot:TRINITY_DN49512_c0_g1_i1.p1 TRINITY_DN49512_c0_g1~~TRINITY_DN49512_c0_g1_i1.p1  ORF type:complete len:628 (-),score=155.58 TRINITY_DN49512_c0_g1_i1:51-1934(-)
MERWDGETVLSSWPAKCKKISGTLLLTATNLVHVPAADATGGGPVAEATVRGIDNVIYKFGKPRPGQDKAVMRLDPHPNDQNAAAGIIVEFVDPAKKWTHLQEMSDWVTTRQEQNRLLEAEQKKEAEMLGTQLTSVLASPTLSRQYNYLVKETGVMSPADFLKTHAQDIAFSKPLTEAVSVDLMPLRVLAAAGSKAARVSDQDAESIFKELPPLGQLFKAAVPDMMSRTQFWERCLQSRYFLEGCGKEVKADHSSDPLFDALAAPELKQSRPPTSSVMFSAHLEADLLGEKLHEGDEQPLKRRKGGSLADRLNERSAGVLESRLAAASLAAGSSNGDTDVTPAKSSAGATPAVPSEAEAEAGVSTGLEVNLELKEAIARRREVLCHAAEELREDLGMTEDSGNSNEPALKSKAPALLQLNPEAGKLPSDALLVPPSKRKTAAAFRPASAQSISEQLITSLRSWASGSSSSSASSTNASRGRSLEAGARWVLRHATDEIMSAELLLASGSGSNVGQISSSSSSTRGPAAPELQGPALETCLKATSLLSHFWSSRLSEASLRNRLAEESAKLVPTLEDWRATTASAGGGRSMGVAAAGQTVRGAVALSLMPPLRRAAELHRHAQRRSET